MRSQKLEQKPCKVHTIQPRNQRMLFRLAKSPLQILSWLRFLNSSIYQAAKTINRYHRHSVVPPKTEQAPLRYVDHTQTTLLFRNDRISQHCTYFCSLTSFQIDVKTNRAPLDHFGDPDNAGILEFHA
jgi:hypothetical protein